MIDSRIFKKNELTAVFIDGANLSYSSRSINLEVDFKKLRDILRENTDLTRIFYYTAVSEENDPVNRLVDFLSYNGYSTITKPLKEITDNSGAKFRKGNMDIELAIDVMLTAPLVRHIILFSGDGDYRRLVEEVQRIGVRVTVISIMSSCADELRKQCDDYFPLQNLEKLIKRDRSTGSQP